MNPLYEILYMRDNYQCRHCKSRCDLHPHHIVYRSHQGPDELTNLITLCAQCHTAVHEHNLEVRIIRVEVNNIVVHFTRLNKWRPV